MSSNLDQLRAADALSKVQALVGKKDEYGNYVSFVKSLGPTILQMGFGQALATELAATSGGPNDTTKGHELLLRDLCAWLGRHSEDAPCYSASSHSNLTHPNDFIAALMGGEEDEYIHAQAEALAYLAWLKKFAVALLVDVECQGTEG